MRARAPRRRVSQADVARAAGVSPALVSVVVNNRTDGPIRISPATRERVQQVIDELGYVPDPAARRMVGAASDVLGVFTYEPVFPLSEENFYRDFLVGVEDAAEEAEKDLLLITSSRRHARRTLYAGGVNGLRLADGGLLLGTGADPDEIRRLVDEGYPFVFIGERHIDGCELSYVGADYIGGTETVVERVHALGHRRIALVATHEDPTPGRRLGYARACARLGIEAVEISAPQDRVGREAATASVLDRLLAEGFTAVVTQGTPWAGALDGELTRRGLVAGRDLSLVDLGSDTHNLSPGTAGLHLPRHEMGQEAVRLLLALIDDPAGAPHRSTLRCGFRDGDSLQAWVDPVTAELGPVLHG